MRHAVPSNPMFSHPEVADGAVCPSLTVQARKRTGIWAGGLSTAGGA